MHPPLLAALNVTEVHASCATAIQGHPDPFGFVAGTEKRTDRARVQALKAALAAGRSQLET